MLAQEWRELERLCERLSDLRERLSAAEKTGNTGLIGGLNREMDQVIRMRDRLVRYISVRLGSTAAGPIRASAPALRYERLSRTDAGAGLTELAESALGTRSALR